MGTFLYPIEIGTPNGTRYERIEASVDTGSTYTRVPKGTLQRLGVKPLREEPFTLADGCTVYRDVGQTWIRVNGKEAIGMVVFGHKREDTLLGAHTLESLLLNVDPVRKRLVPTPGLMMAELPFGLSGGCG